MSVKRLAPKRVLHVRGRLLPEHGRSDAAVGFDCRFDLNQPCQRVGLELLRPIESIIGGEHHLNAIGEHDAGKRSVTVCKSDIPAVIEIL